MHSPGGHFSRRRSSLGLNPSGGRKGQLVFRRHCALTRAHYAPGPKGASALGLKQGVEQFGADRGKWMSYRTTSTERALTLRLIPSPDGDTGPRKRRGLVQSPTAREAAADPTSNPGVAPPGGPGAPGGECALTRRAQAEGDPAARAAVLDALTRDRSNPSGLRGPGQVLPLPATSWGGGGRSSGPPGLSEKAWSSCRPGSRFAVTRAAPPLSGRVGGGHRSPAASPHSPPSACSPFLLPTQKCRAPGGGWGEPTFRDGVGAKRDSDWSFDRLPSLHIQPIYFSFSGVWQTFRAVRQRVWMQAGREEGAVTLRAPLRPLALDSARL